MKSEKLIIVDADAIIAQYVLSDKHNKSAIEYTNSLSKKGFKFIYPATTISEATTSIARKFDNLKLSKVIAQKFSNKPNFVENVDSKILSIAIKNYYLKTKSKKNTLSDCIVAAVAKKHNASAIFSFDDYYRQNGFKLVEDLI